MAELVFGTEVTIFHYSSLYEQIWGWVRNHSKEEGSMQSALLTVSVTKLFREPKNTWILRVYFVDFCSNLDTHIIRYQHNLD